MASKEEKEASLLKMTDAQLKEGNDTVNWAHFWRSPLFAVIAPGGCPSPMDQRLTPETPQHVTGWSCWVGGRLFVPSVHPPVASLCNPASALLVSERTDACLQGPNGEREREKQNKTVFACRLQASPGHGRPSRRLSLRDANLYPSLFWDRLLSLPTASPGALFQLHCHIICLPDTFMFHIKSCNVAVALVSSRFLLPLVFIHSVYSQHFQLFCSFTQNLFL